MNKQRIKTNLTRTAANTTYYAGTIGAALTFHHYLNDNSALAVATLVVFVIVVEGLLRTLLTEVLDAIDGQPDDTDDTAAIPAKTEGAAR